MRHLVHVSCRCSQTAAFYLAGHDESFLGTRQEKSLAKELKRLQLAQSMVVIKIQHPRAGMEPEVPP